MKKPIIGINTGLTESGWLKLEKNYCQAICRAGGIPVFIPSFRPSQESVDAYLSRIDGLLLSGGDDPSPRLYKEKPLTGKIKLLVSGKERFDLQLVRSALKKKIPILGICYGAQLLNIVLGGSLFQDIATQVKTACEHRKTNHKVYLCEGTLLHDIIGKKSIITNSFHHQSIKEPGKGLRINARSEDALIEGIELAEGFCLGIQWHPERMMDSREQVELLRAFIQYAVNHRHAP